LVTRKQRLLRDDGHMPFPPLRSERLNGPIRPVHERLQLATANGLLALLQSRIDADWLAGEFPETCPDPGKTHIFATNLDTLRARMRALVPDLQWPLTRNNEGIDDDALFDLVEFVGRYVAEPEKGRSHDFYEHHALSFSRAPGADKFRDDVNELLRRGAAVYTMSAQLTVERIVPAELSTALSTLNPATGDSRLDAQIERGRALCLSRREEDRLFALQDLWGAYEHMKTIEVPGQNHKKVSSEQLLAYVQPEQLRDAVRKDMLSVTELGNSFRIRHHEAHVPAVPADAYDYFAGRITNLLLLLLRQSDRIA
jgi:hypothetical protein